MKGDIGTDCIEKHYRTGYERLTIECACKEIEEAIASGGPLPDRLVKEAERIAMIPTNRAMAVRHWLAAKLKAIELLMRHEGMLIDRVQSEHSGTIALELREALGRVEKRFIAAN